MSPAKMAETKSKNAVNGVSNAKPSSKASKLCEAIRSLLTTASAVDKAFDGLQDFEKLVESEKMLRKDVEDKAKEIDTIKKDRDEQIRLVREAKDAVIKTLQAEIERANNANSTLTEQFEKRAVKYRQTEAEHATVSKHLEQAQQGLNTKDGEIKAALSKASEFQQASEHSAAQLGMLAVEKEKIEMQKVKISANLQARDADLRETKMELQQLRKVFGDDLLLDYSAQDLNRFCNELASLAENSRSLVTEFFSDSDSSLDTRALPLNLSYLERVPLPKSGSTPELRRIFAQASIAESLRCQIFQPFFLPPKLNTPGQEVFSYLSGDVQRATAFRCQILAACDRNDTIRQVVSGAVDKVHREIGWYAPPDKIMPLKQRLESLFEEGGRLWSQVQRSRQLILCEQLLEEDEDDENNGEGGDDSEDGERPGLWEEYGPRSRVAAAAAAASGAPGPSVVATLFPPVIVESGEYYQVLYPGVGLWSDQAVIVAASRALTREQSNGRVNGRVNGEGPRSPHGRRRSVSGAPPSGRG